MPHIRIWPLHHEPRRVRASSFGRAVLARSSHAPGRSCRPRSFGLQVPYWSLVRPSWSRERALAVRRAEEHERSMGHGFGFTTKKPLSHRAAGTGSGTGTPSSRPPTPRSRRRVRARDRRGPRGARSSAGVIFRRSAGHGTTVKPGERGRSIDLDLDLVSKDRHRSESRGRGRQQGRRGRRGAGGRGI